MPAYVPREAVSSPYSEVVKITVNKTLVKSAISLTLAGVWTTELADVLSNLFFSMAL